MKRSLCAFYSLRRPAAVPVFCFCFLSSMATVAETQEVPKPNDRAIASQADEPSSNTSSASETTSEASGEQLALDRDATIKQLLTGVKLKGQFTMDGKPLTELQDETYEIRKVLKLKPESDLWAIHARIKYGVHDLVVPVPLQIKWAGTTPVLTMDKMSLPGLGTFSARVVLHDNRYAGTWQHDSVGGHLFGTISPTEDQSSTDSSSKVDSQPDDQPK